MKESAASEWKALKVHEPLDETKNTEKVLSADSQSLFYSLNII